jgi:hypothetical protein
MGGCCGSGGHDTGKNNVGENQGKECGSQSRLLYWIAGGLLIIVLYYLLNGSI